MKKLVLLIDRFFCAICRKWRNYLFYAKTGSKANLIGNITIINRNIKTGKNVTIYPECMFYGDGEIVIGDNVSIGNGNIFYASKSGGLTIGDDVMIGAYCYITDADHGTNANELMTNQDVVVDPTIIGSDVWIASGAKVLKGSNLGKGCVIGAQAVVKGNIPENSIATGIPAKVIRERT